MSQITNDGLTRSGTGCFIAVYPYGNSWCQMVNTFHDGPTDLLFLFHLFSLCAAVVSAGPTELCCATLRELRVVLVLGRSVKKIRQDRVWRRTITRKTLKKLSLPIFECQHTVTLKTWNGNAVKLANSNNRLFMKTDRIGLHLNVYEERQPTTNIVFLLTTNIPNMLTPIGSPLRRFKNTIICTYNISKHKY